MVLVRRAHVALVLSGLLLAVTACGGSNDSFNSSSSGSKGDITLSGQDFTEMKIMSEMYKQVLENAGYNVDLKLVKTRDVYIPELESGNVQVVPEYLSGIADKLNLDQNGPNAKPVTTNDATASLAALKPLADQAGITMLDPSQATDQNAFAVKTDFAQQNSLTTLSDLAALNQPLVLAAADDCKDRTDCAKGLSDVYNLDITKILPLGFATTQTKDSVIKGEAQLGETYTTDGSVDQLGLTILEDDKGIQPAQNLIPAVNSDFLASHPDVGDALNKLSGTLTTQDLSGLDLKVDVDRADPATVAKDYLTSKGLI